jgi:CheY-like chemotaxis protein
MARILIADENPEFRSVLRDILEPIGHSTHEAVDAKKAVSCACSLAYQLIILSLSLPKQGGMRALRAIADECPDIPVIVTVDSESAEAAVKAMKLGACHTSPSR